ncbi:ferredoxin--NADP reductase [Oricola indica]|uniref:ferredoxin--NADP reductase n=1 Tax=Oricola indica TaxID=2872591 RepID=UPI003CCC3E09
MNDLPSIKETGTPVNIATPLPDGQTVTEVKHWTDKLFSFRLTRPQSLRFRSGEFVMIGLMGDPVGDKPAKPILRAYSIASPSWDEELEFYSIAVPDGPLTSKLVHIKPGDQVILKTKPVGTLVVDALLPGKRLYMIATGTGIAPFASLIRDPEVYEKFDQVILTHTCRQVAELDYGRELVENLINDPLIGEMVDGKLVYYPTTTREESPKMGRITDKIRSGELFSDLGLPTWSTAEDRVMICGSMGLNLEIKELCEAAGMEEGANSQPGHFVLEKSFVGEGGIL